MHCLRRRRVPLAYLIYALGTTTLRLRVLGGRVFLFVPMALAASAIGAGGNLAGFPYHPGWPSGRREAFLIAGMISLPTGFWPYPNDRLSYVFTVLLALKRGAAVFMLWRRVEWIGTPSGGERHWGVFRMGSFLLWAASRFHLGTAMPFITFAAAVACVGSLVFYFLYGFFFFPYGPGGGVFSSRAAAEQLSRAE